MLSEAYQRIAML